ncbi:MAG: MOSC domain-containing protein [Shimia sp.]|uniref:MOSC domain-containing protein n=1 Tax=Shimia sp. TaxID=1954381 RepID=UPI004057FB94
MPALKPTQFEAEIVWLGGVADRGQTLAAEAVQSLALGLDGPEGDCHGGVTRASCSRVSALYEVGTEIANVRQLSVVSQEELDAIAAEMGLEAVDPAWLGTTLVVKGIPDFTHVPPNARLQAPDGATITVDMENRPCIFPGRVIEGNHPGHGRAFKAAAQTKRGVTAWVERAGRLAVGDKMRLFVPDQPVWSQLSVARGL